MKFEEVLPALRQGKRVRREGWANGAWLEHGTASGYLYTSDILATDWTIVDPDGEVVTRWAVRVGKHWVMSDGALTKWRQAATLFGDKLTAELTASRTGGNTVPVRFRRRKGAK